jgi:lipocalin
MYFIKPIEPMIDKTTIAEFDLNRYLGKWYEIARFPHSFEKDLIGVTATYTLLDNGRIEVLNQGYKKSFDGEFKKILGKAKTTEVRGKLRVSFFLFFYSDYNILELDPGYQWVLIGSSTPDYLWILSRSPHMDKDLFNSIVEKARKRGYKTEKLIWVLQKE